MNHESVMVEEVLGLMQLAPGDRVVDGTVGLAGHSTHICRLIGDAGTLFAFDWDPAMLAEAERRLADSPATKKFFRADYREVPTRLSAIGTDSVDAVFWDMGLNNAQIMDPERGISFLSDAPLDMRMDTTRDETAASFLESASEPAIERVLRVYGDERWSKKIAQVIVSRRRNAPLSTTTDLVNCVMEAILPHKRESRLHPATRTFQALRIHINRELEGLSEAIISTAGMLAPGGVFVVLAYHSGEDREVKHVFKDLSQQGEFTLLTKKPLVPTDEEVKRNPKSRSAKLRALQRKEVA